MNASNEDIATAISRHQIDDAYSYLADDVRWNLVGAESLIGKEAVRAAFNASGKELDGVETIFDTFNVRVTENCVVIESVATYLDGENEGSAVASCDIYDFVTGKLAEITSYNIELYAPS